jgi:hypothetical protein
MRDRFKASLRFAGKHLLASIAIAVAVSVLVFGLWYPHPFDQLASGRELFALVMSVDVVAGPLLSLIVFNPMKSRRELVRDIGVIVALQTAALSYGLFSVAQARPVYMAFEGDRFRVVSVPDLRGANVNGLSLTGPKLIGVRLLSNTDPAYLKSIQLAMQGVHPAFRPERWMPYDSQREQVLAAARPLADLKKRRPQSADVIVAAAHRAGRSESELGYLPLHAEHRSDWVVVLDMKTAVPIDYLPVDGWD